MSLDLRISADSAMAHLAGALDRPVWLPLAKIPHWPWQLAGERGVWSHPVQRMREQLLQLGVERL
jgi:hypothetical protein